MKPAFWYVPVVLLALGRHFPRKDRAFTVAELLTWAPDLVEPKTVRSACSTLQRNGLLERAPDTVPPGLRRPSNPQTWRLTADGREACRTAVHEAAKQSRVASFKANKKAHIGRTLYGRLWNLLRNRKQLTTEEAVATLADAGQITSSLQNSVSRYLRGWQSMYPDHIKVSAKRINGFKRYVVVQDPGTTPPPAKAAAHEATAP